MALFVEIDSVDKQCKVIINLDTVLEICPLKAGGCEISIQDSASVGGKTSFKVKDNYDLFKQFAMQTVSADDVAKKVAALKKIAGKE